MLIRMGNEVAAVTVGQSLTWKPVFLKAAIKN